ncbi:MAG: nucleotidyltransferase domain-containing protein [Hyphomicrobium sp.]
MHTDQEKYGERAIPPSMDAGIVSEIDRRLETVEREHGVAIAFAIESGSRAWGFPSPDSDYDCRFVFVRPQHDYLSLFPQRDVIETELTPVFDVNGWDLSKALKLLLKGNAVIIEWLTSPIVYRARTGFRAELRELAATVADRSRIAHHYLALADRQMAVSLDTPADVSLKKLFYVMRPAIALRWLRLHPGASVAPMNFPVLCSQSRLESGLETTIAALLARKAETREMGRGPAPDDVMAMIESELAAARDHFAETTAPSPTHEEAAGTFFRKAVASFGRED